MMRTTMIALTLAALATSAAAAGTSQDKAAGASRGSTSAKPQEVKYCFQMDDIVGSRIRGKSLCKTKAQWAREGIDVDRPSRD